MAFRFRKFRQSLRLIPTTKSLGFSTRVNEGDQAKSQSATPEGNFPSKLQFLGHCGHTTTTCQGLSLLPRTVNQVDAVQLCDILPKPVSFSPPDVSLISLSRLKKDIQRSFDDLELLMSAAKPVVLTYDDILPMSEDVYGNNNPSDITWERSSVKFVLSSNNLSGSHDSASTNFQDFSHIHGNDNYHSCASNSYSKEKPYSCYYTSDSDSFHTFLFSLPNQNSNSNNETPKDGPSAEQLHYAQQRLEKTIPTMFSGRYDYSMLHKNVIFENNIFGNNKIKTGVVAYALELLMLRARFYARYTSIHTEVLNVSTQEQNGIIRIHWRLKGLPQTQILKFWRLFQKRPEISKEDWEWFEAFSYYHIGKDGLVHRHRIDRMLPDNEEPNKLSQKLTKFLNPAKPLVS